MARTHRKQKVRKKRHNSRRSTHIKNKYQQRKKLGIEYCKHFICDNEKWMDFFTNFKKKDDLADAYLLIRKYLSEK